MTPWATDTIFRLINSAHAQAAQGAAMRGAAYTGNGFSASTRNTCAPLDVTHARSEGGASRRDHSAYSEMGERERGFRR
jgi:Tfp pilus assembly protein PilV